MPEFEAEQESRLWRWMLGLVVLALAVWATAEWTGTDRRVPERADTGPGAAAAPVEPAGASVDGRTYAPVDVPADAPAAPPPVDASITGAAFQAWVRDSAELHERTGHEYVAAGLQRLLSALRGLAERSGDSELALRAAAIQSEAGRLVPDSPGHAAAVRDLFVNTADLVVAASARIGAGPAAERNVQQALRATDALDTNAPLDRQRHRVFSYFDHMAEAMAAAGRTAAGQ